MASIQHRQRADGTVAHRVMFREHTGGKLVGETFDTAGQADNFAALIDRIGGAAARAKRARAETSTAPTLTGVLDDYLDQAPDISPGTAMEYRRQLGRSGLETELGMLPVDMIDRQDVEAWVRTRSTTPTERTKRPPSPKTLRNEHGLLSTLFAHAADRGWTTGNAAKGVRLPKTHRAELDILTETELLALHDAMTDRYKPLVWLLAATGLRWGEATALQWRDVSGQQITVRQSWKHDAASHKRILGVPKTVRGTRRIETTAAVIDSLGPHGKPTEFVFTNTRGEPVQYGTFQKAHWTPTCETIGLSPAPKIHGLRHFAASYMLSQGADIFEVSRALGHESVSTTSDVYGHLIVSRTRPTAVHAARLDELRTKHLTT